MQLLRGNTVYNSYAMLYNGKGRNHLIPLVCWHIVDVEIGSLPVVVGEPSPF